MIRYLKKKSTISILLIAGIVLLCIAIILPFIILSFFNVPGAEDDLFHGFWNAEISYFKGIRDWYCGGYNGRYANALIMQFPARPFMNIWFAKIFPIVLIGGLYAGLLYLFNSSNRNKWKRNMISSLFVLAFFCAFIPDIHLFHWFSGASVYVLPAIFYFFLVGIWIRGFNKNLNKFNLVLSIILSFLIVGSHENWMVVTLLTVLLFFINSILQKEKIKWQSYLILGFIIIFTLLVIFAPGSGKRLLFEERTSPNRNILEALNYSFVYTGQSILKWFLNPGFLVSVLGILLLPTQKKKNVSMRFSLILIVFFFILIYSGFFVLIYSVTNDNVPRFTRACTPNFMSSILILLLIVRNFSCSKAIEKIKARISPYIGYGLIISGLVIIIIVSPNTRRAYSDILSGNARKESFENAWVQRYLKNCPETTLSIPKFNTNTQTIMFFTISHTKEGYWYDLTSGYFKKDIIIDDSLSIEEFIRLNSKRTCFTINSQSSDSLIYKYKKDRLLSTPEKKIVIQVFFHESCNDALALIVNAGSYTKEIPLNDCSAKNKSINYSLSAAQLAELFDFDEIKLHIVNHSLLPISIESMEVFLK